MNEYKLREIFNHKLKGEKHTTKYIVCPSYDGLCDGCEFYSKNVGSECKAPEMKCCSWEREDGKNVVFERLYKQNGR